MALMFCFFTKSIIAKQFKGSRIKCMCIFHVLTVRGLPGSEGASTSCMWLLGNAPVWTICFHMPKDYFIGLFF